MFYQEKIIDGVLHYRQSPNDEFRPFSAETLTEMLMHEREVIKTIRISGD